MHIYFSGMGGTGIGPLALIAHEAGCTVSGSDKKSSKYTEYLKTKGLNVHIGQQDDSFIRKTNANQQIDWFVYSSALPLEQPNHPELVFVKENGLRNSKRDIFLSNFLDEKKLKLIAVAGTHGKTTTTAMLVWAFLKLNIPVSYSIGAKTNFSEMGHYDKNSQYFIYECDEFDKNFLSFKPYYSLISSIDWDHHEIYPTRDLYKSAFRQYIDQSSHTILFDKARKYLGLDINHKLITINNNDNLVNSIKLAGQHNRENARLCIELLKYLTNKPSDSSVKILNNFPGTSRRFEKLSHNVYSDYAHTPEEIKATIQMALEISKNVMVVYEPLTNRRQYYMKNQYYDVFNGVETIYWVPSYLAREDPDIEIIHPAELIECLENKQIAQPAILDDQLMSNIKSYAQNNGIVLLLAGGGGGSLDEWARANL